MSKLYQEMMEGLREAAAFLEGQPGTCRVHIPDDVDVRRIRSKLQMTQQKFAKSFGLSVDAVRHWEAGRRVPQGAARALLKVIDREPVMVQRVLSQQSTHSPVRPSSTGVASKTKKLQASAA